MIMTASFAFPVSRSRPAGSGRRRPGGLYRHLQQDALSGLRAGYVVIPRPLVSDLKHAHAELYRGGHSLIQMALAEFITAGHYSAHIRRMRLLYSRRRAF